MTKLEQSSIAKLQPTGRLVVLSHYLLYVVGFLVLIFCYLEYRRAGWALIGWDWMFISGLIAFIIALYFARSTPIRMTQTLYRLVNRGSFALDPEELDDFKSQMDARSRFFASILAVFVGLAILVAFMFAYGDRILSKLPETILETSLGLVAGYYIGQMIAYGTMGQLAMSENVPIVTQPGHIDRAAGLKPIGDFYFFQAMVVAIPSIFLAVWWFIIPILTPWYSHWRSPYLVLLIIALAFEILSFIIPMWAFHIVMRDQKIKHLVKADELSNNILVLEEKILAAKDAQMIKELQQQLDFQRGKYWDIEQMPTWPVDATTRRRFTINNIFLFLPFILDMLSASDALKRFLGILVKILGE